MKALKMITVSVLLLVLSLSQTSCLVVHHRHSSGTPKGWNKNTNNPHHPNTTNPGRGRGHKNK